MASLDVFQSRFVIDFLVRYSEDHVQDRYGDVEEAVEDIGSIPDLSASLDEFQSQFVIDFLVKYSEDHARISSIPQANTESFIPMFSVTYPAHRAEESEEPLPTVSLPAPTEGSSEGPSKRKHDALEDGDEIVVAPPPAEAASSSRPYELLSCKWPGCHFEAPPPSLWEHIYTHHLPLRERYMGVPDEGREVGCEWGDCAVKGSIADMLAHWRAAHKEEAQNEANGDPHDRFSCKRRACWDETRRVQVSNFPRHMANVHYKSEKRTKQCEICGSLPRKDLGRNREHFRQCLVRLMDEPSFKGESPDDRQPGPSRPSKRQRRT